MFYVPVHIYYTPNNTFTPTPISTLRTCQTLLLKYDLFVGLLRMRRCSSMTERSIAFQRSNNCSYLHIYEKLT